MYTKAKIGLSGALVSLVSGLIGTYFYLTQETDIDRVLRLDSQPTTKKGRCRIQINGDGGRIVGGRWSYNSFYEQHGDRKGVFAGLCLKKLFEVNKEVEDVVLDVKQNSNGTYTFEKVTIVS